MILLKVNAFITVYNTRTKHIKDLSPDVVLNIITDLIKPIKYVPFEQKLKMIDKTIEDSKSHKYPTAKRYVDLIMNMIALYTDLEIKKGDFDILSESGLLDIILSTFDSEYKFCSYLMQMCLQDLESG